MLSDVSGNMALAFSYSLGILSSLQVEAVSLLFRVCLCASKGYSRLILESNSQVLVLILSGKYHCPWQIKKKILEI